MSEYFSDQPTRQTLLAEFQTENDRLGILDAYQESLRRKITYIKEKPGFKANDPLAAREVRELEGLIDHGTPIVPYMWSVISYPTLLCLRQEDAASGLATPGSSVIAARLPLSKSGYVPEQGFNDVQTSALLDQLTRIILLQS